MRVIEDDHGRFVARIQRHGPHEQFRYFAEVAEHPTDSVLITCHVVKIRKDARDHSSAAGHSPRFGSAESAVEGHDRPVLEAQPLWILEPIDAHQVNVQLTSNDVPEIASSTRRPPAAQRSKRGCGRQLFGTVPFRVEAPSSFSRHRGHLPPSGSSTALPTSNGGPACVHSMALMTRPTPRFEIRRGGSHLARRRRLLEPA